MRRLSSHRDEVNAWRSLQNRTRESLGMLELAEQEQDEHIVRDIEREAHAVEQELAQREFQMMLAGEHDRNDAILAIHAGAGGTESQDWAAMLLRMFTRWAEGKGFKVNT